MYKICGIVVLMLAISNMRAELTEEETKEAREALYSNDKAYGGDMILNEVQKAGLRSRVAINNLAMRWPSGRIPYVIDPSLSSITNMINDAAKHIANMTGGCIKWVPRSNEGKYVRMYFGNGCWSPLGMSGPGLQDLSLGKGCHFIGTVIHEMLHAVGFHHEQNRPDRDTYLNIYWPNILSNMAFNFNVEKTGLVYNAFDWDSIMLYGEQAFTNDWNKKTMEDKTRKHKLLDPFNKKGMTQSDAYEVKRFYGCS